MEKEEEQIIIKKVINVAGGHHGGAWKVAYADFVTAMMAFFLLLWLLNVTTDEQKNAISNYFDPTDPKISESQSGAGGQMGGMSMATEGAMATNIQNPMTVQPPKEKTVKSDTTTQTDDRSDEEVTPEETEAELEAERIIAELEQMEEERFEEAKDMIEEAISDSPELQELTRNLIIDMTPEGLRIQIVDREGKSMFPSGSARMYQKTKKLIAMVAEVINKVPNKISIRGHTDSVPYGKGADYTNWELSTDRANAARRALLDSDVLKKRIHNVQGRADTEHLIIDKPKDPRNRRLTLILMRKDFVLATKEANKKLLRRGSKSIRRPFKIDKGYKKTEGEVQFP